MFTCVWKQAFFLHVEVQRTAVLTAVVCSLVFSSQQLVAVLKMIN
jgi:hypothetical protein